MTEKQITDVLEQLPDEIFIKIFRKSKNRIQKIEKKEKEIYEKYSQNRKYLLNYYQNVPNDIIEDFNSKKNKFNEFTKSTFKKQTTI